MNTNAVTCDPSSDFLKESKSAPESTKVNCNCCWFIAVLIAANILLDLCCVAIAAYAILNVRDMQLQVSKHMSNSDGTVIADTALDASLQMLFEDVNATRYQLRILTENVSVLSASQGSNSTIVQGKLAVMSL